MFQMLMGVALAVLGIVAVPAASAAVSPDVYRGFGPGADLHGTGFYDGIICHNDPVNKYDYLGLNPVTDWYQNNISDPLGNYFGNVIWGISFAPSHIKHGNGGAYAKGLGVGALDRYVKEMYGGTQLLSKARATSLPGLTGRIGVEVFGSIAPQVDALRSSVADSSEAALDGSSVGDGAVVAATLIMPAGVGGKAATKGAGLVDESSKVVSRLFTKTKGGAMDSTLFKRIQSAFERKSGRIMESSKKSEEHLDFISQKVGGRVQGETLSQNVIALRRNPSVSSVYEELIHTAQLRRGMTNIVEMEIEAARKLIRFADRYRIPKSQTRQTEKRLEKLLDQQ